MAHLTICGLTAASRLLSAALSVPHGTSPALRARAVRTRRVGRFSASDSLGSFTPAPFCALDARTLARWVGCRFPNFCGTAVPRERREDGGQDTHSATALALAECPGAAERAAKRSGRFRA